MDSVEALRSLSEADVPVFAVVPATGLSDSSQAIARQLFTDGRSGPVCRFPVRLAGMPGATN
jgi:crotonobetainyl-CoA:carnitine CoA-transferase CaiB-like acyl-CoA transferase